MDGGPGTGTGYGTCSTLGGDGTGTGNGNFSVADGGGIGVKSPGGGIPWISIGDEGTGLSGGGIVEKSGGIGS